MCSCGVCKAHVAFRFAYVGRKVLVSWINCCGAGRARGVISRRGALNLLAALGVWPVTKRVIRDREPLALLLDEREGSGAGFEVAVCRCLKVWDTVVVWVLSIIMSCRTWHMLRRFRLELAAVMVRLLNPPAVEIGCRSVEIR